jgi:hypothetical protein
VVSFHLHTHRQLLFQTQSFYGFEASPLSKSNELPAPTFLSPIFPLTPFVGIDMRSSCTWQELVCELATSCNIGDLMESTIRILGRLLVSLQLERKLPVKKGRTISPRWPAYLIIPDSRPAREMAGENLYTFNSIS